jgi:RHS repeat-associated protein
MLQRGDVRFLALIAVTSLLFACGDGCRDTSENNDDNSFEEPVGEWTPEACEGGEDDDGDGAIDCVDSDCYTAEVCAFDPNVAPPDLPSNGVLSLWERSKWLFEDGGPQRGVADGAITPENIGTVRGRVLGTDGEPLEGASVALAGHADLGRTYTRTDGTFDLAFDAGRRLVLRVAATDHITSDRKIAARLQRPTSLGDIVLVPNENDATQVDFSTTAYVAGTRTSDDDGERKTAAIIPEGTRAKLVFPNGASRPIEEMHVRATEVTVGDDGPQAMMAELPPGTLYTYAAEFTVDEAVAENASGVEFDRPVFVYVDNFLGFAPGTVVPSGFYDRGDLNWAAMPDGVVVEVTEVSGSTAVLSLGDGPLDDTAKDELGVTDGELEVVANNYEAGDTLWRIPTRHFSPYDFNWPGPFPPGAAPSPDPGNPGEPSCTSVQEEGSIIGCSNQTLSERIPLNGTPFTLAYQSGRVSGRKPVVEVPVLPDDNEGNEELRAARVRVTAAGQPLADVEYTDPAEIPATAEFVWDGRDQFGRKLQGAAEVEVEVALVYNTSYATEVSENTEVPDGVGEQPPEFGDYPAGDGVSIELGRAFVIVRRQYTQTLTVGTYDVTREGLGGWTIDAQHRYDPIGRVMYYGNGQDLPAGPNERTFSLVSGYGRRLAGPRDTKTASELYYSGRPAIANDGVIYVYPDNNRTVLAIDPVTNALTTVVGQNAPDLESDEEESEDGVLAADAALHRVVDVRIGKDNRLYIRSTDWIWRLEPDDTLSRLVGFEDHYVGPSDDPRDRTATELPDGAMSDEVAGPWEFFDATADGTLYLGTEEAIYRRTTDGRIRHVAPVGGCASPPCGDGEPAMTTPLGTLTAMGVSAGGDVYFAEESGALDYEQQGLIRRIRPDGTLETVAQVPPVTHLEVGPSDRVYFTVGSPPRLEDGEAPPQTRGAAVIQLKDDGELVPRVGVFDSTEDFFGPIIDGESAAKPVRSGLPFAISPSGQIVFIDRDARIVKLQELFPGYSGGHYKIPQPGGRVVDEFDANGRHLASHDALTGAMLRSFEYDDQGRLLSSVDADGDVTEISRDGDGNPTSIVGPNGVTWETTVEDGLMTQLTSPEGEVWSFEYDDGLMTGMTNPRGESWSFTYDDAGRLVEDMQPNGATSTLARDPSTNSVLFTSAEGRETTYRSTPPGSDYEYSAVETGDLITRTSTLPDGWSETSTQDGTVRRSRQEAHPVYGLIAAYDAETWLETPSGLRLEGTATQRAEVSEGDLLAGLSEWTANRTFGDGTVDRTWDPTERTLTVTTGEGRGSATTLDENARPVTIERPRVDPVEYTYDGQGRIETVSQGTRVTSMAYDDNGYLAAVTTDDGTVAFSRDLMGRIDEATRPDMSIVTFGWDALGNLTGLTAPGRTMAYAMTHDVRGNLLTMTTPAGHETTYLFDDDYRSTGMVLADGRETSITYDASNRVDAVELDGETIEYGYADTGQLESVTGADADLTMTWDGPLPLTQEQDGVASGTITYTWEDGTLNLASTDINGTAIDYQYDTDGVPLVIGDEELDYQPDTTLVTDRTVGDVSTDYNYNEYGELSDMTTRADGAELLKRVFTYDSLGRIVEIEETNQGATTTYVYTYDLIGQLVQVEASGDQNYTHTYEYDANGNRTAVSNGTDNLSVGDINHDVDDRLMAYGATTFEYNDAGQLTQKVEGAQTTQYVYGVSGELQQVTLPSGQVVEYEHDALQRRVARKVDGAYTHRFLYGDNINPVAEVDASGDTVSTFVYGTGLNVPDYMVRGGSTYYFVRDHLGSVRFVVDAVDGEIAQELQYDEFGQVSFDSNPGFQPFGYAGGLYDPDTGLVRFGARDYDPHIGRWTAPDPIGFDGGEENLYSYTGNAPIVWVDPTGNFLLPIFLGAALGAAGNAFVYGTSTRCTTGWGYVGAAVGGAVFGGGIAAVAGGVAGAVVASGGTLAEAVVTTTVVGTTTGVKLGLGAHALQAQIDPNMSHTSEGYFEAGQVGGLNGFLAGAFSGVGAAANYGAKTENIAAAAQEAGVSGGVALGKPAAGPCQCR